MAVAWRGIALLVLTLSLSTCTTVSFYMQAATGQLGLMLGRQPVERILGNPDTDPELARKLQLIAQAREFAGQSLGLSSDGSYTSYVHVERRHLVWNVFAAPAFSVDPLQWCFPIAGCVTYRGYFSESAAQDYAQTLAARGFDVYVGGVDAYSTLGWLNDPIPSTIMRRPDHRLAGLIFHELAHQLIYVPGDTTFNESFASFVEQEGLRRWLTGTENTEMFAQFLSEQQTQIQFTQFVTAYRDRLAALYNRKDTPVAEKLALQEEMREQWFRRDDAEAYRGWFEGPLNNAQLATVSAYFDWLPAFATLLDRHDGDLQAFYQAVRALAHTDADSRHQRLTQLVDISR